MRPAVHTIIPSILMKEAETSLMGCFGFFTYVKVACEYTPEKAAGSPI